VRILINDFEDTQRIEPQYPVVVATEGIVQGAALKWERRYEGKRTSRADAKNVKTAAEAAVQQAQKGDKVTLPLISYYGTGRLWQEPKDMKVGHDATVTKGKAPQDLDHDSDDLADSFNSRLAGYRFSIDPRCSPKELLRWLKFEQEIAHAEKKESRQFRVVKAAIQSSVEGCKKVDYHPRLGLLLDIEGQPRLPFSALSDGQRNMLAMVGDLAFKAAQLNPHLGDDVLKLTPGIVLIDELDLHLHPWWQQHVAEDLRTAFPEVQFIATTHSPFVVQSMRAGELQSLDAQPVPVTGNLGVEEIARGLMGVPRPEVSPRYAEMKSVALNYLATLEEAVRSPDARLAEYEKRLAEGIAPYADNPAFQAFLEMERAAALGNRHGADGK
jgi:predicted ATP-binding protein involved in virulence